MTKKQRPVNEWPLSFSNHAHRRMAQRNITSTDISFVVGHGMQFSKPDAVAFFLRQKDIPSDLQREPAISRLVGVTVIASKEDGAIITAYRNGGMKPGRASR